MDHDRGSEGGTGDARFGMVESWTVIRIILASLLIVTAVLKVANSAATLASGGFLASSTAIALVVSLELFAGSVIAIGPGRIARRFSLFFFSGLAVVAAWAWWTDQACGCFGP